jgi:hypothetical protein
VEFFLLSDFASRQAGFANPVCDGMKESQNWGLRIRQPRGAFNKTAAAGGWERGNGRTVTDQDIGLGSPGLGEPLANQIRLSTRASKVRCAHA